MSHKSNACSEFELHVQLHTTRLSMSPCMWSGKRKRRRHWKMCCSQPHDTQYFAHRPKTHETLVHKPHLNSYLLPFPSYLTPRLKPSHSTSMITLPPTPFHFLFNPPHSTNIRTPFPYHKHWHATSLPLLTPKGNPSPFPPYSKNKKS